MIITTGKVIKIDVSGHLRIERSCETPGAVTVTDRSGKSITLPASRDEAERVIAAYRRALVEDIPYRKSEVEST